MSESTAPCWKRFESSLWNTSSLILVAGKEALLVEPSIDTGGASRLSARADELGAAVTHVLITHADWDHVCGIAAFPDALVTMGPETRERVTSGAAVETMEERAKAYGLTLASPPRVDRVIEPGRAFEAGPFQVEPFSLPGHTDDGIAYRFRNPDLLAVGDCLSSVEFPFASSTSHCRATLAGLIEC